LKKNSIKVNFIYNSLYQILLIITPLLTSPYVSRVLGSTQFGVFSYTYAIANVFALFGMLGITNYGNRTIAAVQNDREERSIAFWNIFTLQFFTSIITVIVYLVFVFAYCPEQYRAVAFVQIITVFCSTCDINWYFFGVEKFKLTVSRNIIIKIVNVALIFIFVNTTNDVALYTLIVVGSLLLSNLAVWPFLKNEINFIRPSWIEIRKHIPQSLALFMPVIAITMYTRVDKIMVGSFGTMAQAGYFENTEKIMNIPNSLIAALGTVMLPRMSNLYANGKVKTASRLISISLEFVSFLACALAFGVAGIAPEFASWFFGPEFSAVGPLLMAIAPAILFISWANVLRTQYLIPLHRDAVYIVSVWIGAIVNIIINLLLVPKLGAMGAVIGTIFAEGSVMIYQVFSVRKELPIHKYLINSVYFVIDGGIMWALIRQVANLAVDTTLKLFLEIVIGGIAYTLICIPFLLIKYPNQVKLYLHNIKGKIR